MCSFIRDLQYKCTRPCPVIAVALIKRSPPTPNARSTPTLRPDSEHTPDGNLPCRRPRHLRKRVSGTVVKETVSDASTAVEVCADGSPTTTPGRSTEDYSPRVDSSHHSTMANHFKKSPNCENTHYIRQSISRRTLKIQKNKRTQNFTERKTQESGLWSGARSSMEQVILTRIGAGLELKWG